MNVGHLHEAVHDLAIEQNNLKLIERLKGLQAALQQSSSQPTPENASAFKQQYDQLQNVLLDAPTNFSSTIQQKIFEQLNAKEKYGRGLWQQITSIVSSNNATPAGALEGLTALISTAEPYYQRIAQLNKLFDFFELDYYSVFPGDFEIGIALPLGDGKDTLDRLRKETAELDRALKAFREVAGDGHGSFNVKSIASSEWQLFIETLPATALCISIAIERIVALYKSHLEIRALKKQLEGNSVPQTALEPLEAHINQLVGSGLQEIAKSLIQEFQNRRAVDNARMNELEISLTRALKYLTTRIDNGATIEVRALPPEEPTNEDGSTAPPSPETLKKSAELTNLANRVNEHAVSIRAVQSHEGPTLSLEGGDDDHA